MAHGTRCLVFTSVAALIGTSASPQASAAGQGLHGVVRETPARASGRRLSVCVFISSQPKCAAVDSAGAYRFDSLPLVKVQVAVICETVRMFGGWLVTDSIQISSAERTRRDWAVSMAGCDLRPVRRMSGDFSGHYVGGFEASEFRPCEGDGWFTSSDSLELYPFDNRRAWVTWSERASKGVRWPQGAPPRDSDGNPRYFVRWRGTVVGPGRYGHMGISAFEFLVDSLLEIRVPSATDCR